jgi:hypothetical protein
MARRVMERAQPAVTFKEGARAVVVPRRDAVARDRTDTKLQRLNGFAFAMIEGNRPPGAAAGSGMAAAVRRVKAQTLRHDLRSIIVMLITGL